MHNREPSPSDTGDFIFFDSNFGTELAFAESTVANRPAALRDLAARLNTTHTLDISRGLDIIIAGQTTKATPYHGTEEKYMEIYGQFLGFETVNMMGRTYLSAQVLDLHTDQNVIEDHSFVISEEEGFEWSLLPNYPPKLRKDHIDRYAELAGHVSDLRNFLTLSAMQLTHRAYDVDLHDMLQAIEHTAGEYFDLFPGNIIRTVGTEVLLSDGRAFDPEIIPPEKETALEGIFEGLIFDDRTVNRDIGSPLCLVMSHGDKLFAIQPCDSMIDIEVS